MAINILPARVPIGRVTPDGGVLMTPEFARLLSDLLGRVGGENGMSADDLAALASSDWSAPQISGAAAAAVDPGLSTDQPEAAAIRIDLESVQRLVALVQPAAAFLQELESIRVQIGMMDDAAALVRYLQTKEKPPGTVTGSRGGNAALTSLLTVLASSGIIINSTTA